MVTCLLAAIGVLCLPPGVSALGTISGLRPAAVSARIVFDAPAVIDAGVGARHFAAASASATAATIIVAALVISMTSGVLVGLSTGLLMATVVLLVRAELRRRRDGHELAEMLAATRTLAREVRSGAVPAAAISASAAAHRGSSAAVLGALAAAVAGDRGGQTLDHLSDHGSRAAITGRTAERPNQGVAAETTIRLARCWALSARYGVPWAGLIETVSTDLADRVRASAQRSAQVSGPRVSGYVLAVMPGLGIALGAGVGANPLHILLGTGAGHVMLLTGSVLTCAGLAWTARIVRG